MSTSAAVTKDDVFTRVASYYSGFFGTWLMNVGRRAGLLEALAERGPVEVEELAAALNYDLRYVETWCRGAYAFELLEYAPDRGFSLAPFVKEVMLDSTDPAYMGGRAEFFPRLTPDFEMYPERLADGGLFPFADRPPEIVQSMQAATRADGPNMIANVIPSQQELAERLLSGGRILDAGCGAGYALAAFADAFPAAELVGIEVDEVSREAARSLVGDRARIEDMEVTQMAFSEEFDLVYANISLSHSWGSDPQVFESLKAAIKPGGWLLVSDVPYPERLEELRTTGGRLFTGVTVYVSLLGQRLLTPSELLERMQASGLTDVHLADQPAKTRMMALGRKPV